MVFALVATRQTDKQVQAIDCAHSHVDRGLGTIRSERAKRRRKPREDPFRIEDRPLEDLDCLGFRLAGGSAWLSFKFRNHRDVDLDNATDIEHLKALGAKLAAVPGAELREQ